MTALMFDQRLARLERGERLTPDEIRELSVSPDIVQLGMLADTVRRRVRGTQATYVRVASCALTASFAEAVPPAAREVCISGSPETRAVAISAVTSAKAVAGDRAVTGFSWADIVRIAGGESHVGSCLRELRGAGLEAPGELPLDTIEDAVSVVGRLRDAGFERVRLTVEQGGAAARPELWLLAADLHTQFGVVQALNPLPMMLRSFRPTTGYDDVRSVAVARLAAPDVPDIQVDWTRYGPKLAQVALTFGADDVWGISGSDAAPEGRRRAPVEEIRRNIEAAGFTPVERDGRYVVIS
jgi:hypothetical protein